jgi:hypothetical protein
MTAKPDVQAVTFVAGSVPAGDFIAGLPMDGSVVHLPEQVAQSLISAGVAKPASAAKAAPVVALSDEKENE